MLRDHFIGQNKVSWVHAYTVSDIQVQTPDSQVGTRLSGAALLHWDEMIVPCRTAVQIQQSLQWFLLPQENTECFCTEWLWPVLLHACLPGAWGRELTHEGCMPRGHCGAMACPVCPESGKLCRHRGAESLHPPLPQHSPPRAAGAIYGAGSKHGERDCLNAWGLNRHHFLGSYVLHFPGEQHADKQCACQFWETKENKTVSCRVSQPLLWFGSKKMCRNFLLLTAKWWTSQPGSEVYWEHLNMWRSTGTRF